MALQPIKGLYVNVSRQNIFYFFPPQPNTMLFHVPFQILYPYSSRPCTQPASTIQDVPQRAILIGTLQMSCPSQTCSFYYLFNACFSIHRLVALGDLLPTICAITSTAVTVHNRVVFSSLSPGIKHHFFGLVSHT